MTNIENKKNILVVLIIINNDDRNNNNNNEDHIQVQSECTETIKYVRKNKTKK